MKKTVLLLMANLTVLFATADLQIDLDHDGKVDEVSIKKDAEHKRIVYTLSSMKGKSFQSDALESKKKGEPYSELDDGFGRKVVLVTNDVDGFKVLAQNDQILGCSTCGGAGVGDPYQGITVKGKYLSFEENYGACVKDFQVTTFKYNEKKKKWYLHKIGVESTYCNEKENGSPKVKNTVKRVKNFGVVEFSKFEDGLRWED